ncbi:MAG TPA: hypothetical protein VGK85_00920, partial [Myxococcaceae bacterium]
ARRRWLLPALALLAVTAVAVATLLAPRFERVPPVPRTRMLTFRRGSVLGARFGPDGRTIHYSAAWNGAPLQVFSTSLDSAESRPLGLGNAQLLAVSPSGELALALEPRMVLFDGSRGTLARVSSLGGVPREVATGVEYADWSPDGTQLVVSRTENRQTRLEYPVGHVIFEATGWVSHPRLSPDGRRIAFINHLLPADTSGEVDVVDASGGHREVWSPPFDELLGLAWDPDGKSLLITGSLKGTVDFLWRARPGRAPQLVYAAPGNLLLADVSREGRALVMQTDWRQEIEVIRADGTQRSLEWLDCGLLGDLSPDGTKVLMSEDGKGAGGNTQLLLRDVSQPAPVKLGPGFSLALSPDGHWAVSIDRGDSPKLVMIPTGPGEPRRLPPSGLARIDRGTFFPDGKRLALIGAKTPISTTTLFVYDLKTGEAQPLGSADAGDMVAVSRDGQKVAATSTGGIIAIFPLDGTEPIRVDSWDSGWRVVGWLDDGSLVALQPYVVPSKLERFDPRTRKISPFRTIAPLDPAGVPGIIRARITADGRTIAFQLRRMSSTLTVLDWGGTPP